MRLGLVVQARALIADEGGLTHARIFARPDVLFRQRLVEGGEKLRVGNVPRWIKLCAGDFGRAAVLRMRHLEAEKREAEKGQRLDRTGSHQGVTPSLGK